MFCHNSFFIGCRLATQQILVGWAQVFLWKDPWSQKAWTLVSVWVWLSHHTALHLIFIFSKMHKLELIRWKATSCSKFLFRSKNGKTTVMVFCRVDLASLQPLLTQTQIKVLLWWYFGDVINVHNQLIITDNRWAWFNHLKCLKSRAEALLKK